MKRLLSDDVRLILKEELSSNYDNGDIDDGIGGGDRAVDRVVDLFLNELKDFLDYLLKEGYCDSDVYDEEPTAIDRYMETKFK